MEKTMTGGFGTKKCCSLLQLVISPDRIHFLKFILEGYDGMALLSTVDAGQGIVVIRYPPEKERELKCLLRKLEPQIKKTTAQEIML